MKTDRVIDYIDGFNLYFGLRDKNGQCYYWLDLNIFCRKFLHPPQQLMYAKYFTSRIKSPPDKKKRQSTYLEALDSLKQLEKFFGIYQEIPYTCSKCGNIDYQPEEKMTDVNLAAHLITDAYDDKYDTALLISGDRDLIPAIEKVLPKTKRVTIVFPPMRSDDMLRGVVSGHVYHVTETELKNSLLPIEITKPDGYVLKCPSEWH